MLLEKLCFPVQLIDVSEFGLDFYNLLYETKNGYKYYEDDYYLLNQRKINFLKENLPEEIVKNIKSSFWSDFYLGGSDDGNLLNTMRAEKQMIYAAIKPTRKRLISEFKLYFDRVWKIERIPAAGFTQKLALIAQDGDVDYRAFERKFKELPDVMCTETLKRLILGYAERIRCVRRDVKSLRVVMHHTLVHCYPDQAATNSPEGVHQDGMDYIVSAMVVERQNIKGGTSIIYGNDRKTELLRVELKAGQSILQADKNTELWHTVTEMAPIDFAKDAYRSTIGFDITAMR